MKLLEKIREHDLKICVCRVSTAEPSTGKERGFRLATLEFVRRKELLPDRCLTGRGFTCSPTMPDKKTSRGQKAYDHFL